MSWRTGDRAGDKLFGVRDGDRDGGDGELRIDVDCDRLDRGEGDSELRIDVDCDRLDRGEGDGELRIDGDCDGEPRIDGDCDGEPRIDGDCDGEPRIDGDLAGGDGEGDTRLITLGLRARLPGRRAFMYLLAPVSSMTYLPPRGPTRMLRPMAFFCPAIKYLSRNYLRVRVSANP